MAKPHPLASFVAQGEGVSLRLEKFPRLSESVGRLGFKPAAFMEFDQLAAKWVEQMELRLKEQFGKTQTPTTTVAPAPTTPSATVTHFATVSDALAAHIASKSVHGVSEVIGATEEQTLDSKDIGLSVPGKGAFTVLMWGNAIAATDDVTLPAGYSMVVAGTFTVNGSFTINGEFRALE